MPGHYSDGMEIMLKGGQMGSEDVIFYGFG